jgi:hypothetical protein
MSEDIIMYDSMTLKTKPFEQALHRSLCKYASRNTPVKIPRKKKKKLKRSALYVAAILDRTRDALRNHIFKQLCEPEYLKQLLVAHEHALARAGATNISVKQTGDREYSFTYALHTVTALKTINFSIDKPEGMDVEQFKREMEELCAQVNEKACEDADPI